MTLLTDRQMEEAVEAMARAYSGAPFPSQRSRDKARAALTAALPVIERAVLERAEDVARAARNRARRNGEGFGVSMVTDAAVSVADQIVADIRALAGEVG